MCEELSPSSSSLGIGSWHPPRHGKVRQFIIGDDAILVAIVETRLDEPV
jgi:hypothetical protein